MESKENMRVEITQDKLVDLLLHAATREDIASLRTEFKSEMSELRAEFKSEVAELRNDFKGAILELKRSNDALEARIDRQFLKIDNRYNWIIGVTLATGLTLLFSITGMIARGFHWF